jgi:dihydrofolate reductase
MTNIELVFTDSYGVIGHKGKRPWDNIREERQLFSELTIPNAVLLGRIAYKNIPEVNLPLVNRTNIVLTRNNKLQVPHGVIVVHSIEEALEEAEKHERLFVAGGLSVFNEMLPKAQVLHRMKLKKRYGGEIRFEPDYTEWAVRETRGYEDFEYTRFERAQAKT